MFMGEIISIVSGKGGVGKTTVALNIASALHKLGYSCIVVEGNVTSPTAALYLGYLPAERTINNVLKDELSLEQAILTHESGVKLVTCSLSLADLASDYEKAFEMIRQLKDKADLVLIDAGAGLDEEARMAILASNYVMIVTNPELPAVIDALRAVRLARSLKRKVLGVVVNKHNASLPQLPVSEIENIVEAPVIGTITEDKAIHESFAYNHPVVHFRPKAKASVQFKRLAAKLVGERIEERENVLLDRLSFWLHKIGLKYLP